MDKTMIVSGTLDKKDVMAFLLNHNYGQIGGKLTLVAGVMALILMPFFLYKGKLLTAIILGVIAFIYVVMPPLDFNRKASRQIRANPIFRNTITYTLSDGYLHVQLYTGTSQVEWDKVVQVVELKNQFLIYLKEKQALILPKKNFACTDDIGLFEKFIEERRLATSLKKRVEETIDDQENI